jgi:hypothetical protein
MCGRFLSHHSHHHATAPTAMTPSRLIAWLRDPIISEVDYPISTTRGYVEVVAVYLAFFAAGVLRAVLALVGVKRTPAGLSWATAVPDMITTLDTAALAVTVVVVLSGRRHRSAADLGLAPRHNKSPVIPHMSAFNAWVSMLALASIGFFAFAVRGWRPRRRRLRLRCAQPPQPLLPDRR